MNDKFRLGMVTEIESSDDGFKIKDCWDRFLNYVSSDVETLVFDWKDVSDGKILRYGSALSGNRQFFEDGSLELRSSSDTLFIKQLGSIAGKNSEKFLDFLDDLEGFYGRCVNSAKTMRNNLSKGYLIDLQSKGIPVIPTKQVPKRSLINDVKFLGKDIDYIVKPQVFGEWGAGVRKLSSFDGQTSFDLYMSRNSPVIAQPFLEDIVKEGENSLIFLGDKLSHAVRKKNGNFKINYGGAGFDKERKFYRVNTPSDEEMKIAQDVLSSWDDELGYSRIDFIYSDGKPLVSEVEMINPSMYNSLVDIDDKLFPNLKGFLLYND